PPLRRRSPASRPQSGGQACRCAGRSSDPAAELLYGPGGGVSGIDAAYQGPGAARGLRGFRFGFSIVPGIDARPPGSRHHVAQARQSEAGMRAAQSLGRRLVLVADGLLHLPMLQDHSVDMAGKALVGVIGEVVGEKQARQAQTFDKKPAIAYTDESV